MNNIRNSIRLFLDKYLIVIMMIFALLTMAPYVSAFSILSVSHTAGIVYRGVLLGTIGLVFTVTLVIYKPKLPLLMLILTAFYFIAQIITIFVSPEMKNVTIPPITTIMGIAQALIIALSALTYITITKDSNFDKRVTNYVCLFFIVLGIFLTIYSYIFQWESIYHTFNTIYGWNYDVTSIFSVKTEYGFTLFVCSVFSIFYILNTKKYWLYIMPVFFLANMFISRSKTSILCTTIILLTVLIYHLIATWNMYKKQWIISFVIIGVVLIAAIILIALNIGWFSHLNYYISQVIFNDANVVLEDRIHKWSLLLQAVDNPFNVIFGYGERITPLVLSECGCATIGDNIYLTNYGVGGLIKLSLYLALIIYVVRFVWKTNAPLYTKIICLSIQLAFLIGGFFEDDSVIGVTMSGLFASIIFYSCNKMIKVEKEND